MLVFLRTFAIIKLTSEVILIKGSGNLATGVVKVPQMVNSKNSLPRCAERGNSVLERILQRNFNGPS